MGGIVMKVGSDTTFYDGFRAVLIPLKSAQNPINKGVNKKRRKRAQRKEQQQVKRKMQIVDNFF